MATQELAREKVFNAERTPQRTLWPGALTLTVLGIFSVPAIRSIVAGAWNGDIETLLCILVILPTVMLVYVCTRTNFSLAAACAWAWHFVFFGLVPAYQVPESKFYWGGRFSEQTIRMALLYVVLAEIVLMSIALIARSRSTKQKQASQAIQVPSSFRSLPNEKWLKRLQFVHIAASLGLIAIVGPDSLMNGRKAFQDQLVGAADVPGAGSAFFLATSLSIVVPSAGIYFYRNHATGSRQLLLTSLVLGAIVTNPLIGSRFLTGSFLVSILGAWTLRRMAARYIPILIIAALTTIFPSLDLWRGDGQAPPAIAVAWPSETLVRGDYDAFEMLSRAVALTEDPHTPKPNSVYLFGGAIFRWVPVMANDFPDAGTGTAVARATGMGFTNVSMPLVGEGLVLGGLPALVAFYGLLGVTFRWLSRGYSAGATAFGGAIDAATASLLFLALRGSLYSMLGYVVFTIFCGYLLRKPARVNQELER